MAFPQNIGPGRKYSSLVTWTVYFISLVLCLLVRLGVGLALDFEANLRLARKNLREETL